MNKIKGSLSLKIFLGISVILLAVSLLMFGVLRIFMPQTYENELTAQLSSNIQGLAGTLEETPMEQWETLLMSFCMENNASASILDAQGESITDVGIRVYEYSDDGAASLTAESNEELSFVVTFEYDGEIFTITSQANANTVEQIKGIFVTIFPYMLIIILVISVLTAFFYSRFLAKPIVDISTISKKMASMDMTWRCDARRSDEIGVLAGNLNDMASRLDIALKDLQDANEKLQVDIDKERRQEKQRSDFFAAISHEMKTPVTILKGQLDGMILNVGKFKDRDTYLTEAYRTVEAMERLLQEITQLAKLEAARLNMSDCSISALVNDCAKMYESLAQEKGIKIFTDCTDDFTVRADKILLTTAISNVINNAVKYSPQNSTVSITAENQRTTIENSGVYIDTEDLERLFEPLYRIDKSRSRETGGSGLGLYIVKTILELHGFEYQIENSEHGVKFSIIF